MNRKRKGTNFFLAGWLLFNLMSVAGSSMANDNLTTRSDPSYIPDAEAVATLKTIHQPVEIVLFHGAWCKDCQVQVPRFMRILEVVDNPSLVLIEYEVNPQKQDVLGKFKEFGIQYVPTFIVRLDGREIGRIVEHPEQSLEQDLAVILAREIPPP